MRIFGSCGLGTRAYSRKQSINFGKRQTEQINRWTRCLGEHVVTSTRMTDLVDFERAVLCVFELQYAETPEAEERAPLKQQAMAYCEQVKHSEAGWRQNLGLLKSSQRSEAHFYALQTLQELLVLRDGEGGAGLCSLLPEAARAELRVELLLWVQQLSQQQLLPRLASFVLTKLAVVLALLVKADYPERWTSAFGAHSGHSGATRAQREERMVVRSC